MYILNVCEAHPCCWFALLLIHAGGSVLLLRRNLVKENKGVWRRRIYRKYASCRWLKNADTGCIMLIPAVQLRLPLQVSPTLGASSIRVVDGKEIKCCGEIDAKILVRTIPLRLRVIVLDKLVAGIDMLLGWDTRDRLGGAAIGKG